ELLSRFMEKDVTDLTIIGTFNLIFNIFSLVENNVGSAFVIEGAITGRKVDTLKFLPLSPTIETNCVLVWKRKRSLSPVVKELIHRFSTAFSN
ncbi:MAG: LysR family transcriptional regulator, partial [Enterococcus sp.]|nr:LysR family transcriptional regulator [Enterococcus sp.]